MTKPNALFWVLFLLFGSNATYACTSACTRDFDGIGPIVVKSYDWDNADGLVIENKRHVKRVAYGVPNAKRWESKYFSVSISQWGLGMPQSGMNEKGLVVEVHVEGHQKYPAFINEFIKSKGGVNPLQWIQYILDTSGSLHEAVENAHKVFVFPHFNIGVNIFNIPSVHYQVCNDKGECRSFEYLKDRLVVSDTHAWEGLPKKEFASGPISFGRDHVSAHGAVEVPRIPVLANNLYICDARCYEAKLKIAPGVRCSEHKSSADTYHQLCEEMDKACNHCEELVTYCSSVYGEKHEKERKHCKKYNKDSRNRFLRAAAKANERDSGIKTKKQAVEYGFEIANAACVGNSKWQIVYLPKSRDMYFRTVHAKKKEKHWHCVSAHKGLGHLNLTALLDDAECGVTMENNERHVHMDRKVHHVTIRDMHGTAGASAYQEIHYPSKHFKNLTEVLTRGIYANMSNPKSRFAIPKHKLNFNFVCEHYPGLQKALGGKKKCHKEVNKDAEKLISGILGKKTWHKIHHAANKAALDATEAAERARAHALAQVQVNHNSECGATNR